MTEKKFELKLIEYEIIEKNMKIKLLIVNLLSVLTLPVWGYENVQTHTENVALTFDACDGTTDKRILELIKEEKIPVTLFVTGKWMDKNPEAIAFIKSNMEYFKIENHGLSHKEAVESDIGAYHLPTVKDEKGLSEEVLKNEEKIEKIFAVKPSYYRTAGALYDEKSLEWIKAHNFKIGGYTVAADEGATASTQKIVKNLSQVKPGDVVVMHINHPASHVYEGFKEGLKVMQEKHMKFEFLKD